MLKNTLLRLLISIVVFYGLYYLIDQYQMKKLFTSLQEIDFVDKSDLTRLSIISYPETDVYSTFDKAIVKDSIDALSTLEVKSTRRFTESANYYKVLLGDSTNFQTITYIFYDNNFVKREEYMAGMGKTEHFKTEDTLFQDYFYPLLETEMNN